MSFVGDFIGDVLGGITGTKQAGKAAEAASQTQAAASQAGIDEQRRQFDALVKLMTPYVTAGQGALAGYSPYQQAGQQALGGQQALLGLQGADAQQQAISALAQSPQMQALMKQGEDAMLQNAAATGGLRGGNIQGALAQFRPQMLQQMIDQQYSRLGGLAGTGLQATSNLAGLGQASAAGQASAGMGTASNIGNLLAQQGAATAGGQMAAGAIPGQTFGTLASLGGLLAGSGALGGLFGGAAGSGAAASGGWTGGINAAKVAPLSF